MSRLKIFNEALVDHFCPEESVSSITDPDAWFGLKHFLYSYKQKKEFKKALVYAETKLIQFIQNSALRPNLQGQHLETWIKDLHSIAGKTVVTDMGCVAGDYAKETVTLWEKTIEFGACFEFIINVFHSDKESRNNYIVELFNKYNLEEVLADWINILNKAETKEFYESISDPSLNQTPFLTLFRYIEYAKKQGLLTEAEIKAVDKTCRITYPSTIPARMKRYTELLAQGIKECDGSLDAVVELAATAFRDLTKIHPFPNANGRVSTVLMNLILVGFHYPSVILRTQQDLEDESSRYNTVMSAMGDNIKPLISFIKDKVVKNQKEFDQGTVESKPAKDDGDYLLSDALFLLLKDLKEQVQTQEDNLNRLLGPESTPKELTNHLDQRNTAMNLYLKKRLNDIGPRFGFNIMYFPGYVDYTDEELIQIQTGQLTL